MGRISETRKVGTEKQRTHVLDILGWDDWTCGGACQEVSSPKPHEV